jgi:hypothetical protein
MSRKSEYNANIELVNNPGTWRYNQPYNKPVRQVRSSRVPWALCAAIFLIMFGEQIVDKLLI